MNFSELGLTKRIVDDVEKLGFNEPTEIQAKTIPAIIAGRDIMASAETGSGKTAAYALPIVQALRGGSERLPRALILVPTRELAVQVNTEMVRFANKCGIRTVTIYGGVGMDKQTRLLNRGVDVIVATPGRLFDHIQQGNAELKNVKMLVLDEADRMLDMGFTPQVRRIVAEVKGPRQTILFSATLNKAVEKSGEEFLTNPVNVYVNTDRVEPASIDQQIHLVQEDNKTQLLIDLMTEQSASRTVLVFTKTRHRASKICKRLNAAQISAGEIHSDISQNKRESTLRKFRDGDISVLVATDIAARGLDIPTISHVVNYDLPLSAADYVHRIGRTGRAGRAGIALSFVSDDQRYLIRDIEKVTGRSLDPNSPFSASRPDGSGSANRRPASGAQQRQHNGARRPHPTSGARRHGESAHTGSPFKREGTPHQSNGRPERSRTDSDRFQRRPAAATASARSSSPDNQRPAAFNFFVEEEEAKKRANLKKKKFRTSW
ncbi:MAG TPA: DEAD/DEAH box helicase [Planktothrix sp.]|jgi:ATP-dependent RNA helicase RhlE